MSEQRHTQRRPARYAAYVLPILAQAPLEDFARDNSPILGLLVLVILALLIVRLIVRRLTRFVLLSLIVLVGLFIVVERDNITECTQTCRCTIAGVDVELPYCSRDLADLDIA